jgi:hypothetical protein
MANPADSEHQPRLTVENLLELFPDLPHGCWDRPPARARLIPIARQGQDKPVGIFIAALNPYRQFDGFYEGFLDLITGQIAASITNANAYEQERKRAEELAELDRAKTTFFSNVSHELRTPLTLILGPIEDALTSQSPPSPQNLEMLHRNALRLLKLVNGLLDFVRIEVGKLRATFEATDLSVLTAQLASVFRSAVERAGLQLVVDCPPLPEPVYVDREMWEKIILNLISNALKSTFEGEIRVTVRSVGQQVQVSVSDTGRASRKAICPISFSASAHRRRAAAQPRGQRDWPRIGAGTGGDARRFNPCEKHGRRGNRVHSHPSIRTEHLSRGRVVSDGVTASPLQGASVAYVQEAMGWLGEGDRLKVRLRPSLPAMSREKPPPPAPPSASRSFCWQTITPTCGNMCPACWEGASNWSRRNRQNRSCRSGTADSGPGPDRCHDAGDGWIRLAGSIAAESGHSNRPSHHAIGARR